MALKIEAKRGKVLNRPLDAFEKRASTVLELDERAGLAMALDAQIKEETVQLKEMKDGVRELVGTVGVRQASGTVSIETPRFVIQDQLRTTNTVDRSALDAFMTGHKDPSLKARVFKEVKHVEVDEAELVRLVQEGKLTENEVKSFYSKKEVHALIIKARETK